MASSPTHRPLSKNGNAQMMAKPTIDGSHPTGRELSRTAPVSSLAAYSPPWTAMARSSAPPVPSLSLILPRRTR